MSSKKSEKMSYKKRVERADDRSPVSTKRDWKYGDEDAEVVDKKRSRSSVSRRGDEHTIEDDNPKVDKKRSRESSPRSVNRVHPYDERDPRHLDGDGRQEGVRYHGIDDKGSQRVEHGHDGGYGEYEVTDSRGGFIGFGGGRFGGRRAGGGGFYRSYRGGGGAWVDRGGRGVHGGRGGRGNGPGFRGQQSGVHHGQQHGGYRGQQHGGHRGQQHGGNHGQQYGGHRGQQYGGRGGPDRGSHRGGGGMDKAASLRESISSLEAVVKKHDGPSDSLVSIKDSIVALQIELNAELEAKAKEEIEATLAKIKKQTDQVKNLTDSMDNLNVVRDVDDAKEDDSKLNDDDRVEYEALKRRLGSAEFNYMSASCIEDILGKMEATTKELYNAFGDKSFDEAEKLKFVLGISHSLIPAAKHVLYKHLLTSDTAVQRGCVGLFLNKLIKSDRINKLLVKSTNETTPVNPIKALNSLNKKTIIPDLSLMGGKYDQFLNTNNGGCKIINFGNVVLVAFTRSSHMLKKHETFLDVNNKPSQAKCPIQSCKAPFIGGSTVLAPMTIAGPESYGGLGSRIWVCEKHWRQSLEDASDDDFCEAAGLDLDVKLLEENSGLVARKSKRLSLNRKSRRKLSLDQEIKHVEKTVKQAKDANSADMFIDSSEEIGPSDNE